MLNVLCAIVNTSCELGSEYLANNANEYEIMDFMFKKVINNIYIIIKYIIIYLNNI